MPRRQEALFLLSASLGASRHMIARACVQPVSANLPMLPRRQIRAHSGSICYLCYSRLELEQGLTAPQRRGLTARFGAASPPARDGSGEVGADEGGATAGECAGCFGAVSPSPSWLKNLFTACNRNGPCDIHS